MTPNAEYILKHMVTVQKASEPYAEWGSQMDKGARELEAMGYVSIEVVDEKPPRLLKATVTEKGWQEQGMLLRMCWLRDEYQRRMNYIMSSL